MALPASVTLEPLEEARRLWEEALAARKREDLGSLLSALDLGLRAVEVLATHRLRPVAAKFPATIGMRLESPDPAVLPDRDACHAPPVLTFAEVVDLLSADDLPCASPALHSGWEDRRFSCARS
ncbi:MAG: hypothetical protein HUU06_07575, partial [Planctomycetaceae bacterium]|nr:hypothetical protein [Planctomycetaceae bacterium]